MKPTQNQIDEIVMILNTSRDAVRALGFAGWSNDPNFPRELTDLVRRCMHRVEKELVKLDSTFASE